jgi:hypothetical protein
MRLETTKGYVAKLTEEGFSFSVVTPNDFRVVAPNVSIEQITPSNVEIGFVRWPTIKGGKYDGHRLFHHTKGTFEGEFVMFGHGY